MKTPCRSKATYYAQRIGTLLVAIALIAATIGCQADAADPSSDCALTIASTAGGSVTTPGEGTRTYEYGEVVNLVATPEAHHHFVAWTGDVGNIDNDTAAQTIITMEGNYSITASFAIDTHSLVISSTAGGSVTTPGEGTHTCEYGEVVDLVATPAAEHGFVEWTGHIGTIADTGAASTTIEVRDDYSITAVFEPIPRYDLTIDSTGGGSVTTPGEGIFSCLEDEVVQLVAEPEEGHCFVNWSGNTSTIADPDSPSTSVTIKDHHHITANFVLFAGGTGTTANPYQVTDWHHLDNLRNYLDSHFVLMNDLDSDTRGYDELAGAYANDGKGWQPIGTSTEGFAGTIDGQGHQIRDLHIHRTGESRVGLFGVVNQGGIVENLAVMDPQVVANERTGSLVGVNHGDVANCSISGGSVSGTNRIGALVGENDGTVSNCYSTHGSVTGNNRIGGLLGQNNGTLDESYSTCNVHGAGNTVGGLVGQNEGTILKSYSAGSVVGQKEVGGLVGKNNNAGTISKCYSTGSVTGTTEVGGLVGKNNQDALIANSCSTGDVFGTDCVGGLVGKNDEGIIEKSFSTGNVDSTGTDVGGLVGDNDDGEVNHSFWDTETSGQAASDGGTAKTTEEMMDIATFSGADWDIALIEGYENETWYIDAGNDYPRLGWQFAP